VISSYCEGKNKLSQQFLELIDAKARIMSDTAHGICVDWIVPWDGKNSSAIRHDDVHALPNYVKACPLKSTNGIRMVNSWDFTHDPK